MGKKVWIGIIIWVTLLVTGSPKELQAQDMVKAITSNKNDVVKGLLDKGYDPNTKLGQETILTVAIKYNMEAVKLFLNAKGIKINEWNIRSQPELSWKYTHLMLAIENKKSVDMLKLLLDKGALIDAQDEWITWDGKLDDKGGNTALMMSVLNTESAKFLIERGAKINVQSRYGQTALMNSVSNVEITKLLIEKGAKIDLQNKGGQSALILAAPKHPETVKLLIEKGANIALRQTEHRASPNALDCAAIAGNIESAKLIMARAVILGIKEEVISASLHWAVTANQLAMAKYLLDEGANIEGTDADGHFTPLMETSMLEMVKLLVSRGANVNALNKFNYTPLNKAVSNFNDPDNKEKDCVNILNLLLDKGSKLDVQDGNGTTALMWAVQKYTVAKILIERGANVNIQSKDGETALMRAVKGGFLRKILFIPVIGAYQESAKLLVSKGADVNLQDASGKTALMHAAGALNLTGNDYETYTEMVAFLIEKGAAIDKEDKNKNTALYWATRYERTKSAELLLSKGANPAKKYVKSDDKSNITAGIVGTWVSSFKQGTISCTTRVVFNADWTYSKVMIASGQTIPDGGQYYRYELRDGRIWLFNKLGTNAVFEWRFEGKTLVLNGEKYVKSVK